MAVNTRAFSLTSAAYQDVSGGHEVCSFRLPWRGQKDNVIRVYLGTSLPDPDTDDYDEFSAPQSDEDELHLHYTELVSMGRVYVRAARAPVRLVAYRK
jgi:hypothetical protein